MSPSLNRRSFVSVSAKTAAAAAVATSLQTRLEAEDKVAEAVGGRINHSVCKWCYGSVPMEDLCVAGKAFGLQSIELLKPAEIPAVQKHGLTCSMVSGPDAKTASGKRVGGIGSAWNRVEHHDVLVEGYQQQINEVVKLGLNNIICFSGNRDGMDDEQGLKNCAIGLKRLMPAAEKAGVTITMELLNSKVNHPDYMCDHTDWGVELCKAIGSDRFKLLYDIYHMQIMEGDVIATIQKNHEFISHYHTGGVPGRNEIDETQELYYPAIMKAIVETGYKGYVAQEFIPKREDKIASLKQGVTICTV
ncbi:hydroxypyruvate isomerase family protein [Novipirellula artificiosorum]|uniref:Hydroxypyruvate isomerase n=1 Tax=Novipirellula artificiosorum TaxID=2528016 RepID=A0A5C6DB40_9BACT|nr:TIM barrel protein [Novipirellula artificiosorum]TWU33034.1 Hydroxypyruvate isomerase [Novipirellula artificiosorum]